MKIKQLIKLLAKKEQDKEVEFIVASKDGGAIVCMQLENQARAVRSVVDLFKK